MVDVNNGSRGRRRRRPAVEDVNNQTHHPDDFYDDSDDEGGRGDDDDKKTYSSPGHKAYGSACSMGQFFLNPCLCLFYVGFRCYKRLLLISGRKHDCTSSKRKGEKIGRRKQLDTIDYFVYAGSFISGLICLYFFLPEDTFSGMTMTSDIYLRSLRRRLSHNGPRPETDSDVDRIELRIASLSYDSPGSDIGGWLFPHHFNNPQGSPLLVESPDQGGLSFQGEFGNVREIQPGDAEVAEVYWNQTHTTGKTVRSYYEYEENLESEPRSCRRPNWKHEYNPSCNAIHEVNFATDYNEHRAKLGDDQVFDSFYISHGYYRDVWVVHQPDQNFKSIMKMSRWEHGATIKTFFNVLRDALVMEKLTASPRIIDMYGHCGTAVWVEAIPYEMEEVIVPGSGYSKQKDLRDEDDVKPKNDYTVDEKLEIALTMAESLSDLHGFEGGVIVHDDVQLCQWLQKRDGTLKLGDFNRAEIMDFDNTKGEYCKYKNGRGFGNYRAPEEFADRDLDEGIDVYTFGNNIYALLTGLWIFYENEDDDVVQNKVINGDKPYIDPRYRTRSYVEGKLVEIMEKCWEYDPTKRINIFEVTRMLRELSKENEARKNAMN